MVKILHTSLVGLVLLCATHLANDFTKDIQSCFFTYFPCKIYKNETKNLLFKMVVAKFSRVLL